MLNYRGMAVHLEPNRVLMYSHDGKSYGHITKLGRVSRAIVECEPSFSVCCISSSPYGMQFISPCLGVDYLKLPSYMSLTDPVTRKHTNKYLLSLQEAEFYGMRRGIIETVIRTFRPKVIYLECNPLGKNREMMPLLLAHKEDGGRVVWGMNGITDPRDSILTEADTLDFIDRVVDAMVVYNQADVVDVAQDYPGLERLRDRIFYAGYLSPLRTCSVVDQKSGHVFSHFGGGGLAGPALLATVAAARILAAEGLSFLISTGNYLPEEVYQQAVRMAEGIHGIQVVRFCAKAMEELQRCQVFVGAGGYNTLAELLYTAKRSIVFTVQIEEDEQSRHCKRLRELGVLNTVLPRDASPETLVYAIRSALADGPPRRKVTFETQGIERCAEHVVHIATRP